MTDSLTNKTEEQDKKLNELYCSIKHDPNSSDEQNVKLLLDHLQLHQLELEMKNRELMESQSALENARDKYADLYDFSPVGYVSFDQKGTIQEINLTACQLLGHERLVVLGKPFSLFLPLDHSLVYFNHIKKVMSSSGKVSEKLQLKSKDAKIIHIQLESICHIAADDQKVIQSALIDITERVESELVTLENKQQLRTIMNALPVLVAHINSSYQYVFSNEAHDIAFPADDSNYVGKHLRDVIGETAYIFLIPHIKLALDGQRVICEMNIDVAGEDATFLINLLPQLNEQHSIDSFYLIMTDISTYKRQELDVLTHLSSLAHEARIHLIGQMTAEIAHEINQPLAAIANYSVAALRMLCSGKLEANAINGIFYDIDEQVRRASEIINHLKKFSKRREVQRNTTNINHLIEDVLKLMIADEHWFGVEIISELDDAIPAINLDGILIEQVIINLLRNAIEAMVETGEKDHRINIKTAILNDNILISIEDNGPGISHEMQDAIFTPFFSTKETGVGLGLSICKSIIESHHGSLWATHNVYRGSTFYIELPLNGDD